MGDHIRDPGHPYSDKGDKAGGSIMRIVGEAVSKGRDRRIFLDVNTACFWEVVHYLNEHKITSPDSIPGNPRVFKDDDIVLQQILLAFGLGDNRLVHSKKSEGKPKVSENKAESNAHSLVS